MVDPGQLGTEEYPEGLIRPTVTLDQSLGAQLALASHLRFPWIAYSKVTIMAVLSQSHKVGFNNE